MNTVISIASGPSLTRADCELAIKSGYPVIAVNSSWQLIPECHYLFAADLSWWERYHISITTRAERWTSSVNATLRYGLNHFAHPDTLSFNSGQRAVQLAAQLGAERIILLGYDCSVDHGAHWHGEHPPELRTPDENNVIRWREEFGRLTNSLPGVDIINCSRQTSLTCFKTVLPEKVFHA